MDRSKDFVDLEEIAIVENKEIHSDKDMQTITDDGGGDVNEFAHEGYGDELVDKLTSIQLGHNCCQRVEGTCEKNKISDEDIFSSDEDNTIIMEGIENESETPLNVSEDNHSSYESDSQHKEVEDEADEVTDVNLSQNYFVTESSDPEDEISEDYSRNNLNVVTMNVSVDGLKAVKILTLGESLEKSIDIIELMLLKRRSNLTLLDDFWSDFLEDYLEPSGWTSLWSPSGSIFAPGMEDNCIVYIRSVDYADKVALCTFTQEGIDDDPKDESQTCIELDLTELFALDEQINLLNMDRTAWSLGILRIFKLLWQPFDPCDIDGFLNETFPRRKTLVLEDFASLPNDVREELLSLVERGQTVYKKLQLQLKELDNDDLGLEECEILKLSTVKLQFELQDIGFLHNRLESPIWRQILLHSNFSRITMEEKQISETCIVVINDLVCNANTLISVADEVVKRFGNSTKFKIENCLQETLNRCTPGCTIVVGPGHHRITHLGSLENGGSIIGLNPVDPPVIESNETGDIWLVLSPKEDKTMNLENLKFEVSPIKVLPNNEDGWDGSTFISSAYSISVLLTCGTLCLRNVSIKGVKFVNNCDMTPNTTFGIKALRNTTIEGNQVCIQNFSTCLSLGEDVSGNLNECHISSCETGVEVENCTKLILTSTKIETCTEYKVKKSGEETMDYNLGISSDSHEKVFVGCPLRCDEIACDENEVL